MADFIQEKLNSSIGDGARPCLFQVECHFPPGKHLDPQRIDLICDSIDIPAIDVTTMDFKLIGGRKFTIPTGFHYNSQPINMTFYMDETHSIRELLTNWVRECDFMDLDGTVMEQKVKLGSIIIKQYDFTFKNVMITYEIHNVVPTSIGGISFKNDEDKPATMNASFAFSHITRTVGNESPVHEELKQKVNASEAYRVEDDSWRGENAAMVGGIFNNTRHYSSNNFANDVKNRTGLSSMLDRIGGSVPNNPPSVGSFGSPSGFGSSFRSSKAGSYINPDMFGSGNFGSSLSSQGKEFASGMLKKMNDGLGLSAFSQAKSNLRSAFDSIRGGVSGLSDFQNKIGNLGGSISGMYNSSLDMANKIASTVQNIPNQIHSIGVGLSNLEGKIVNGIKNGINSVRNKIKNFKSNAKKVFSNIKNSIGNIGKAFKNIGSSIKDAFNNVKDSLSQTFNRISVAEMEMTVKKFDDQYVERLDYFVGEYV